MKPERRRILRFALHFAIGFPLCLWLYPHLLPAYQSGVIAALGEDLPDFLQLPCVGLHIPSSRRVAGAENELGAGCLLFDEQVPETQVEADAASDLQSLPLEQLDAAWHDAVVVDVPVAA